MRKKGMVLLLALLVLGILAIAGVVMMKDSLIIQLGVVRYRNIRTAVFLVSDAVSIVSLLTILGLYRKGRRESAARAAEAEEKLRASKPVAELSVHSRMDAQKIQDLLQENMDGEWKVCGEEIGVCLSQMQAMDRYQDRLRRLLDKNGADALHDTEDILDQVEQFICKNVRKVLNYMDVADSEDPSDREMIQGRLQSCQETNAAQLEQTQKFLYALTEFLNRQGDGDTGADMLEMYRQTILDSLDGTA